MPIEGALAIIGAAGRIGRTLRHGLRDLASSLRSIDVRPIDDPLEGEETVVADITDPAAIGDAVAGAEAVIHLAAIATEAPFDDILETNVRGTYHLFEAARRHGVRRVVFASSIHATGFYPWDAEIGPNDPVRPDSYYGVSKVFGEALGRLYADKHGLEVVCIRIVGFSPEPRDPGYLWGWLSPPDCVQLFRRAVEADGIRYLCLYGVSRNARAKWSTAGWDAIGYQPIDDAEAFAERFEPGEQPYRWQGMRFPDIEP